MTWTWGNDQAKQVIPFCISGGSAFSDIIDEIRDMKPAATVLDGLHIGGSSVSNAESRVNEWVTELGLSEESERTDNP